MTSRRKKSSSESSISWREKRPNGAVQLTREPIPPMREDLQQIIEEMK